MTMTDEQGSGRIIGKALVCVTEDWFALSHFKPLIGLLVRLASEVVVACRFSGREGELRALGARVVDFEYHRSSLNPVRELVTARRLAGLINSERPDVVHLIAMKPIVLGALALRVATAPCAVVHMTGLGFLAISETAKARLARPVALRIIAGLVRRPTTWLLCENEDDRDVLAAGGVRAEGRTTILGGAGVDPSEFPVMPSPAGPVPVAAYTGRMIRSKGVDVLMQARSILATRGIPLAIDLYGHSDTGNPEAIPEAELQAWSQAGLGRWHGPTSDIAGVWRRSDIFVLPARTREGMPRALLEAASCGRPLVVSDVPGCRHFVRDGVEGLIVPPSDARALADALGRLAKDAGLRARLGAAARARLLAGYTTGHVLAGLEQSYRRLLSGVEAAAEKK